jgi:hypothetical protein
MCQARRFGGPCPPGVGWQSAYLLQHEQFGAVQMRDYRKFRRDPQSRVVQRCEVVQVQNIRPRRSRRIERSGPRRDLTLGQGRGHPGEHPVGSTRPVLEGRMQRLGVVKRVIAALPSSESGCEVHRVNVETREECRRVRRVARNTHRTSREPRLPAGPRQGMT